jgi:hypothetical protein
MPVWSMGGGGRSILAPQDPGACYHGPPFMGEHQGRGSEGGREGRMVGCGSTPFEHGRGRWVRRDVPTKRTSIGSWPRG